MKLVKDCHKLSTGMELEEWKEEYILKMYRLHKHHPLAKIVMGRKCPIVVIPKLF